MITLETLIVRADGTQVIELREYPDPIPETPDEHSNAEDELTESSLSDDGYENVPGASEPISE